MAQKWSFKLHNSLYVLKQVPRQWYAKLHNVLVEELEDTSSASDPCIYVLHESSSILIIVVYVEDLLIAGSSKYEIAAIKGEFRKRFEMKDLGPARVSSATAHPEDSFSVNQLTVKQS